MHFFSAICEHKTKLNFHISGTSVLVEQQRPDYSQCSDFLTAIGFTSSVILSSVKVRIIFYLIRFGAALNLKDI